MEKYYAEIDTIRHAKDPVKTKFTKMNYLNQYRDLKIFHRAHIVEEILSPIGTYEKVKTFYPIQLIDHRFQIVYGTPKKIGLFYDYEENPTHTK